MNAAIHAKVCENFGETFLMKRSLTALVTILLALGLLLGAANLRGAAPQAEVSNPNSLHGTLRGATGDALAGAAIELRKVGMRGVGNGPAIRASTDANGHFNFAGLAPGRYRIAARWAGNITASREITVEAGDHALGLHLIARNGRFLLELKAAGISPSGARGIAAGNVGSQQVSNLPLEQRDSSKLLLLAAGTTTTSGSGGNFTQQYSIHGQRGTTAVFALDGADTTDPELGGATIFDFNVDAIQRIDSVSGVMPASVGEGAAGYANIISKSGGEQVHGVAFEFLRNSALDARNYFDLGTPANPGRIPPFIRNEFGVTNGGPVFLPHLYDGRERTFYFVEYQGLRQIQGTTQVLSVPTQAERSGQDTTAFPGDTLFVPINPQIQPALNIYPLPNAPTGAFGPNTYATNSKVDTSSDQFSVRIDQRVSDKAQLTGRFTYENTVGPITNPDQTAINPSYVQLFTQGYRGVGINYIRIPSPTLAMTTTFGFVRSTPVYNSINQTQPALTFGNKLFEAINSESGGARGTWSNLYQLRQTFTKVHGAHAFAGGGEVRVNRDTTEFSFANNGSYSFGSGPAYSPVNILSASGQHNINVGDLLPDALTGFLTGTPYSYNKTVGGRGFPQGDRIGEAGVRRAAFDFFFLDNWKATRRLSINYGLRYEINTPFREPHDQTSGPLFLGPDGKQAAYNTPGVAEEWVVNPRPPYRMNWNNWGPRVSVSWEVKDNTVVRAGAGITTLISYSFPNTNLFNLFPSSVTTSESAQLGAPIPFSDSVTPFVAPVLYTPQGAPVYPKTTRAVAPNTPLDINRFERDLAALLPGDQVQPLQLGGQSQDYHDGYLATYTLDVQQKWDGFEASASYIGLAGVGLQGNESPNNYQGASAGFAPFSQFNSSGQFTGGFGPENLFADSVHSSYNAGEFVIQKLPARWRLGFSASYTYSRSIDNSTGGGGFGGGSNPVTQAAAQDPQNLKLEKGPSSFNVSQNLSFTVSLGLPFDRIISHGALAKLASGWQIMGIGQLSSGLPFTVFSGVQQTGYGNGGGDRPDQIGRPVLSTSRANPTDYFGMGDANASFFYIPIGVPNGTGPFQGRFGTLGRNTFIGPPLRNLDVALWKDTTIATRRGGQEYKIEFRTEFYNIFNTVNFGLPNNVLTGSGFGFIHSTAANSRQLQVSLKFIY